MTYRYRSSVNGRFVTKNYAGFLPDLTVRERIKSPNRTRAKTAQVEKPKRFKKKWKIKLYRPVQWRPLKHGIRKARRWWVKGA